MRTSIIYIMRRKSIACTIITAGVALLGVPSSPAQIQTLNLQTVNGTGGVYITNVNNEAVEPNSGLPGSKNFDYPYYFDPNQGTGGLYVVIVAEQLSATTTYAFEEANFTIENKTVTDPDFGVFSFGQLSWDASLLTGSGTEFLGPGLFSLTLDLSAFSPLNSPRNVNNEFAWDYAATATNPTGTGLTFTDGVLSSVDFTADIAVSVRLLGNPGLAFANTYDGSVTFAGDSFVFDVDVTQDNASAFGTLTDTHLVFDAAGNMPVPEPTSALLLLGAATGLTLARRVR